MKPVEAEYALREQGALSSSRREGRVGLRALVNDLASTIHARDELRQIGVRDEAKMLGGSKSAAGLLLCLQFLDEFQPVH